MDYLLIVVALLVTASSIGIHLVSRAKKAWPGKLPPGSLGLPVIGQTIGLVRAMRGNTTDRWIRDRVDRYGPVSKLSVFGKPTVLLSGQTANKFMFFSKSLQLRQTRPTQRIIGERSFMSLSGEDHRRMRGALTDFLKPDMLKQYITKIDAEVRHHVEENWAGRTTVTVLPLMKRLTLDLVSALLFGLESGAVRDALMVDFRYMLQGVMAFPINLPFTTFSRSLKARRRAVRLIEGIMREKKAMLKQGKDSPNNDLISRLLSIRDDHGEQLLTDEEIIDNSILALISGQDSTSILMTFMVRHLANDPATLAAMLQEHEEIAKDKADGEALTWEDLSKMKFTWRVAQETLRIVPPVVGGMRTAVEDVEFDGYLIPRGWQVHTNSDFCPLCS
ncbi:hypothetical protein ACQ4PT_055333 [Festuca glaucescens]